jgi:glutamate-1-semialdehyde 2,1-aminomutase
MFTLFFGKGKIRNFSDAKKCQLEAFTRYFNLMLDEGIYLAPSQFEALFVSNALTVDDVNKILSANLKSMSKL